MDEKKGSNRERLLTEWEWGWFECKDIFAMLNIKFIWLQGGMVGWGKGIDVSYRLVLVNFKVVGWC